MRKFVVVSESRRRCLPASCTVQARAAVAPSNKSTLSAEAPLPVQVRARATAVPGNRLRAKRRPPSSVQLPEQLDTERLPQPAWLLLRLKTSSAATP